MVFQLAPLGVEIGRRHAHDQGAGVLHTALDLEGDGGARFDDPIIQPHPQPVLFQPPGQSVDGFFILAGVAQKQVVLKGHDGWSICTTIG